MDDFGFFDTGAAVEVLTPPPVPWSSGDQADADLGAAMRAASAGWSASDAVQTIGRVADTVSSTVARLSNARTGAQLQAARLAEDRYRATRETELARYRTDASIEVERIRAQALARRAAAQAAVPILPEERTAAAAGGNLVPLLVLAGLGFGLYRMMRR